MIRINIVFIRQITRKVCRLKIHRFRKIERLDGLHKVIRHFFGTVNRNILEPDAAAALNHVVTRWGISVLAVLVRRMNNLCVVAHVCIRFRIEQPEWHINSLYFIDAILIAEQLRQKAFAFNMPHISCLCRLFVQLERNHIIRFEHSGKSALHNDRIIAERAFCCRRCLIRNYFAAAGIAAVIAKAVRLALLPFTSRIGLPFHVVGRVAFQLLFIAL